MGWYDASDAATLTSSGGLVSQWNDKSGGGRHLTATTTARPTTAVGLIGGRNALRFDGVANVMTATMSQTQPITVFVVARCSSGAGTFGVAVSGTNSLGCAFVYRHGGSNTWNAYAGTTAITAGAADLNAHYWRTEINGASSQIWRDGVAGTGPANLGSSNIGGNLYVGSGGWAWTGDIGEVIVYSGILSAGDITSAETYLRDKWLAMDPLSYGWHSAYWPGGPRFTALALADGDPVSTLPDEAGVGNLHDMTSSSTERPLYRATGGANSKRSVEADKTNDRMNLASGFGGVAQPWTLVAVFRLTTLTGLDNVIVQSTSGTGGMARQDGPPDRWQATAGGTSIDNGGAAPVPDTNAHLMKFHANGASSSLELDGTSLVASTVSAETISSWTLFTNGSSFTRFGGMHLMFFGFYPGTISGSAWTAFKAWVASEYALTIA
jgi:hypothetical protein